MDNKEDEEDDKDELELRRLQEIAKVSSIYQKNLTAFERNPNLSRVVHAVMHFAEFSCVLMNELFHHIHHAINRTLREINPDVPDLPEERNPIFFVYPICMTISLILGLLWLISRTMERKIDLSLVGCTSGVLLMLSCGIFSMRHAEIYINLEEVSDAELLDHPIFIHNFIMCIISILAMEIYLIHFWILYDCWQWRKKESAMEDSEDSTTSSSQSHNQEDFQRAPVPTISKNIETVRAGDLGPVTSWNTLKNTLLDQDQVDLENEPVILYCCCVDYWKYLRDRESRIPMHEFQVVHIK